MGRRDFIDLTDILDQRNRDYCIGQLRSRCSDRAVDVWGAGGRRTHSRKERRASGQNPSAGARHRDQRKSSTIASHYTGRTTVSSEPSLSASGCRPKRAFWPDSVFGRASVPPLPAAAASSQPVHPSFDGLLSTVNHTLRQLCCSGCRHTALSAVAART